AAEYTQTRERQTLKGDVKGLDELLGGGMDLGTSTLLLGPAGSGKSSVAINYACAAAKQGQRAALFVFDERIEVLLIRAQGLGMDLRPHLESGRITIQQVDPAELSPGEFAHIVRSAVDGEDGHPPATVVVIDSLNGYMQAMPEERYLTIQ